MPVYRTRCKIRSSLRRFTRDRDGVSAIEFALVLPLMVALYIGGAELGNGYSIQFKAALTARTVTDLASQEVSINNSAMSGILNDSAQVMYPYATTSMSVTLSEITTDSHGNGTVTWSDSLNGTARVVGSTVVLPTALQTANITILLGEVNYPYTPQIGNVLTGTINVYENQYFYPRLSTTITRVNS